MYTFRLSNKTQTGISGCSHQLDRLKRQFQLGYVRWLFISSLQSSNMAAHTWQSTEFSSDYTKASLSIKTGQCLAVPEPSALCVPAVASTPYKRWSICTMEKVGEAFLQKLRGSALIIKKASNMTVII